MRARSVATALLAFTAGAAASAALHRLARRRRSAAPSATGPLPAGTVAVPAVVPAEPVLEQDAVVLDFPQRPVAVPVPVQPAAPARCGDSGGRTRAGAPCAARATSGGRCHHHRLAA